MRAMEKGGRFGRFDDEKNALFLLEIEAQIPRPISLWPILYTGLTVPALVVEFSSSLPLTFFYPVLEETKIRIKKLNRP